MTSLFRNQNENTTIAKISSGPSETEKESLSAQFQVHENQPTSCSNKTQARMFLRRRIVLLTLALILAIVVITVTIVGLLISSYNERQQAEAEAREATGPFMEMANEKKVSSIAAGFPDVGDPDADNEQDTFLPVSPARKIPDTGSGVKPLAAEKTAKRGKTPVLHVKDEVEIFSELGSGDSSGDQHEAGSGDSSGDRHEVGKGCGSGCGSGAEQHRFL
ncbi:uncharacterized protein LOC130687620 isoform X2 [Daphnia carinata]|uniref:uncharacterized protein LOC130687620 isoform X2 n=1 Tax=Daphnia carinata TaxID=120202 RepID=UPI00257A3CB5|nr:uncharacterized protein LOC130687620 isoform X2 [Daphnia carinata]